MLFCPLCSGSSGNATFIEAGDARILVDAGLAGRRIAELLNGIGVSPDTLDAILVTHEHSDHVHGVGVLSRRYGIPVYANADCFARMLPQTGALAPGMARVFEPDRPFFVRDVEVLPATMKPTKNTLRVSSYVGRAWGLISGLLTTATTSSGVVTDSV